ncbi:MAG: RNA 2',3'-cyclic phosphodiesterase [Jiangellaceae bacterium]
MFVAVTPPPEVTAHLDAQVAPLRDDVLRWTTPEMWHVTLAFYGDVPDGNVVDLHARLGRAARRHPALTLGLAGAGRFAGRALWVGCAGDVATLRDLARSVAAAGRRGGAPVEEGRRFRAHVTLARSARPVELTSYVATLAGYEGPVWTAGEISLVNSRLGAGDNRRPRYETLATFPLAGSGG